MPASPLAAVVLDALAADPDPQLDRAIGAGSAQRLRRELRAIARRWVAAAAPGNAFEATSAAAALMALHDHDGPVVLVAPDVPWLDALHIDVVRADLAAGAAIVFGTAHDASPYLLAFAAPERDLLELTDAPFEQLLAAVREREGGVGLARHERRLVSAADARALAADPLAPAALVAHLGRLRAKRASNRPQTGEKE